MKPTASNPLGLSPNEAAKLEGHANKLARLDHDWELRKRGLAPKVDDVIADIDPTRAAARKLAADRVEAIRPKRRLVLAGELYDADDIILPWPSRPLPGFLEAGTVSRLDEQAIARTGDKVTVLEDTRIAGKLRKAGDVLEIWPSRPLRGFLSPRDILDLLRDGLAEPAPLIS